MPKSDRFLIPLGRAIFSDVGGFLMPKMVPKLLPNGDKFRYQLPKGHFLFGMVIPNGF